MTHRRRMRIALVGAGRVGSVLGRVLSENGERITAVVSRTRGSATRGGRFVGCKTTSTRLCDLPVDTDLVLITTPHEAVEAVASELATRDDLRFRLMAFCHASGMLTADVLAPLRKRGATVFSFHPLQTFPRDFRPRAILPTARGIYYGVDGTTRGIRVARDLARRLEGHVIVVPPEHRQLYHAACVVASNHLTVLLSILESLYRALGVKGQRYSPVFAPIISSTLRNVARTNPRNALSGPVARGGVDTIAGHLDALQASVPDVIPYYARLTMETVRLAIAKGSITSSQTEEMTRLLLPYLEGSSYTKEMP
jgi:predicted short-subunit dehydrogenase-like oxidoreductase (DUF2520 family)